jgi:hypothetical protein
MSRQRASDLLYESEAALRLVDDALHRMIDLSEPARSATAAPSGNDVDAEPEPGATLPADAERRAGLERALLLLGELDAGQGRATHR